MEETKKKKAIQVLQRDKREDQKCLFTALGHV